MQPTNRLRQQRRCGNDLKLVSDRTWWKPERRYTVGRDDTVDRGMGERRVGARHEQPVGNARNHLIGTVGAGGPRRPQQGSSAADEVIDDDTERVRNFASEQIA